jgi:glycerol-3-phosphate acyltransferase PlsY
MPVEAKLASLAALCFLIGSIPFGPLLARRRGVDLRKTGSGNIGATNVLRSVGKWAALFTLLGDALKGTAAVAMGKALGVGPLWEGIFGLLAVLGHDFSPFMRLRGGKGVATSLGVMLIYAPKAGMLTLLLWLISFSITRISSVGALVSFALLPVCMALLGYPGNKIAIAFFVTVLLVIRHSGNVRRILNGTERRVGERV